MNTKDIERFRKQLQQEFDDARNVPVRSTSETKEDLLRRRLRIAGALIRIKNNLFGRCCECEEELEKEFLLIDPAAPFCIYCQEELNAVRGKHRHASEKS